MLSVVDGFTSSVICRCLCIYHPLRLLHKYARRSLRTNRIRKAAHHLSRRRGQAELQACGPFALSRDPRLSTRPLTAGDTIIIGT